MSVTAPAPIPRDDTPGRLTSFTFVNGVLLEYGYDNASRLTSITIERDGQYGDLESRVPTRHMAQAVKRKRTGIRIERHDPKNLTLIRVLQIALVALN